MVSPLHEVLPKPVLQPSPPPPPPPQPPLAPMTAITFTDWLRVYRSATKSQRRCCLTFSLSCQHKLRATKCTQHSRMLTEEPHKNGSLTRAEFFAPSSPACPPACPPACLLASLHASEQALALVHSHARSPARLIARLSVIVLRPTYLNYPACFCLN